MAGLADDTLREGEGWLLLASYPWLGRVADDDRSVRSREWRFAEFTECSPSDGVFHDGGGDGQDADLDAGDPAATIVQVPRKSKRATFHRKLELPFDMIRDMREAGVEPFDAPGSEMKSEVVGMLRVESSIYYDGIVSAQDPLSVVGKQLREFFVWPKDFYEVSIEDVWRLEGAGVRIQRCIGEHRVPMARTVPTAKAAKGFVGQRRGIGEDKPQDVCEPCFQTFALPAHLDDIQVEHLPSDGSDEMLGYPLRVALAMREGPARVNTHNHMYINLFLESLLGDIYIYIYISVPQTALALRGSYIAVSN